MEREEELGFTITPRKSRRHKKEVLADLDFALLAHAIAQAQELLLRVETECSEVALGLNGPKTKYITYSTTLIKAMPLSTPGLELS